MIFKPCARFINLWVMLLFFITVPTMVFAASEDGSCEQYKFLVSQGSTAIEEEVLLRVIEDGAKVYDNSYGDQVQAELSFGDIFEPLEVSRSSSEGRIKVKSSKESAVQGWVERRSILCAMDPLKNERGLERKLFIKPKPSQGNAINTVTAYFSSDWKKCPQSEKCRSLSRFEMYFIIAERSDRYLLAKNTDIFTPLVGWVNKEEGTPWNTALGIRPADTVKEIQMYPSLDATHTGTQGITVFNKDGQWYKHVHHIALLDQLTYKEEQYYKVAAPGVGITQENFEETQRGIETLGNLKQVDVFFLLDGTRSMQPFINKAREIVQTIAKGLRTELGSKETKARFGFRIYRDLNVGTGSIGEGLPLPLEPCDPDVKTMDQNLKTFTQEIEKVRASTNDPHSDSYPEALFAGLTQAVEDMSSCTHHTKILIVVGDHGDNQSQVPPDVVAQLKIFSKPIVLFFVQTPARSKVFDTETIIPESYTAAYERFQGQAMALLYQTLPGTLQVGQKSFPVNHEKYLLCLGEDDLCKSGQVMNQSEFDRLFLEGMDKIPGKIWEQIQPFFRSDVVNETMVSVSAGESLEATLEQNMNKNDLPVLFWVLAQEACKDLKAHCVKRVDHRVIEAYTKVSEDWVEEIWMESDDLESWIYLLSALRRIKQGRSFEQHKRKLVKALIMELQQILGSPPVSRSTVIAKYAQLRGRLPIRKNSPFMQFSPDEILKMERCEFYRLIGWIESVYSILNQIRLTPEKQIHVQLSSADDAQCKLSDTHKTIPHLKIETAPFPNGGSYAHYFEDKIIYWIPTEFLP